MRIGSGVTFARLQTECAAELPAVAMAARTVGSAQIRERATIGGNLGTGSPAGDGHPALLVADAVVEVASVRGTRRVPVSELFTGPGRIGIEPDEIITAVSAEPGHGPQTFSKVGRRGAMAIALCSFALSVDFAKSRVRAAIGSAAPVPLRAVEAERFLEQELLGKVPAPAVVREFARLVTSAASPIDDIRTTADYRRHALGVLAGRAVRWVWKDYRCV